MHQSIATAISDVKQNDFFQQYLTSKKMTGKGLFYQVEYELDSAIVT